MVVNRNTPPPLLEDLGAGGGVAVTPQLKQQFIHVKASDKMIYMLIIYEYVMLQTLAVYYAVMLAKYYQQLIGQK